MMNFFKLRIVFFTCFLGIVIFANQCFAGYYRLDPDNFNKMYKLASKGDVQRLTNAIYRGLNINAVNDDGDSGVCVAAKKNNFVAYDSFLTVGATPRPPCSLRYSKFDKFIKKYKNWKYGSSYLKPGNPEAVSSFSLNKWLGGLAVIGGGVALAGGGGGGGGGGGSQPPADDGDEPNFVIYSFTDDISNSQDIEKEFKNGISTWGGIYSNKKNVYNSTNIILSGDNTIGMMSAEAPDVTKLQQTLTSKESGNVQNTGKIDIFGNNSYGMFATSLGVFEENNQNSPSLTLVNANSLTNKGVIEIQGKGVSGMTLFGMGKISNEGNITSTVLPGTYEVKNNAKVYSNNLSAAIYYDRTKQLYNNMVKSGETTSIVNSGSINVNINYTSNDLKLTNLDDRIYAIYSAPAKETDASGKSVDYKVNIVNDGNIVVCALVDGQPYSGGTGDNYKTGMNAYGVVGGTSFTNNGSLKASGISNYVASSVEIINKGTIESDYLGATAVDKLENYGTISVSEGNNAVYVSEGSFYNDATGEVNGNITFMSNATLYGKITNSEIKGRNPSDARAGTLSNYTELDSSVSIDVDELKNYSVINGHVSANKIDNKGTLNGGTEGDTEISNNGSITGDVSGLTVNNNNNINTDVEISANSYKLTANNITNSGEMIFGGGIYAYDYKNTNGGTLTNNTDKIIKFGKYLALDSISNSGTIEFIANPSDGLNFVDLFFYGSKDLSLQTANIKWATNTLYSIEAVLGKKITFGDVADSVWASNFPFITLKMHKDAPQESSDKKTKFIMGKATIETSGEAISIEGSNINYTQTGVLTVTGTNSTVDGNKADSIGGIKIKSANGSTITNSSTISATIESGDAFGINADGGVSITNNGSVTATSSGVNSNVSGVSLYGGATITNDTAATISAISNEGSAYGILSENGNVTNTGTISSKAKVNSYGIHIKSGTVTNSGTINSEAEQNNAYALYGVESSNKITFTNSNILNSTSTKDAYGFYLSNTGTESTITNSGTATIISKNASAVGVHSVGQIKVTNSGTLNVKAQGGDDDVYGINLLNGANGSNAATGTISVAGKGKSYGVFANNTGDTGFSNAGTLNVSSIGNAYAMYASPIENGIINFNNAKTVTVSSDTEQAYGMYSSNKGDKVTFTNSDSMTVNANKNAYGFFLANLKDASTITNSGNTVVTSANSTATGIYADGKIAITNSGTLDVKSQTVNGDVYGLNLMNGANGNNAAAGNIKVTGSKKAYGVSANNTGDTGFSNAGTLTVTTDDNAFAFYAYPLTDSTIVFSSSGTVDVTSNLASAYGMYSSTGGNKVTFTNSKDMNVSAQKDAYGFHLTNSKEASTITNSGTVKVATASSTASGVYADGKIKVENSGTLEVSSSVSSGDLYGLNLKNGAYGESKTGGKITVTGKGNVFGVYANNTGDTGFSNAGTIEVETKSDINTTAYGLYANPVDGGTVCFNNTNIIKSTSAVGSAYGMYSSETGDKVTFANSNQITVTAGDDAYGFYLSNSKEASKITNDKNSDVKVVSKNASATGIYADGKISVSNLGKLNVTNEGGSDDVYGVYLKNGASLNDATLADGGLGTLKVTGRGIAYGVFASAGGASTTTSASISSKLEVSSIGNAFAFYASPTETGNVGFSVAGDITAKSSEANAYGFYASGNADAVDFYNNKNLSVEAKNNAYGLYLSNSKNNSKISLGTNSVVNVKAKDGDAVGVYADGQIDFRNAGTLEVENESISGDAYGVILKNESHGYNGGSVGDHDTKLIKVTAPNIAYGVYISDTPSSYFTNNGTITVHSTGSEAYGTYALAGTDSNLIVTNNGTINATSDLNFAVGMYGKSTDTGTVKLVNSGTINVSAASGLAHGMLGDGAGTTLINTGTIVVNDVASTTDTATSDPYCSATNGATCSATAPAMAAFSLRNGARMINMGTIESNENIDLDAMSGDDGEIVIAKNSTISAPSISGAATVAADNTQGSNDDEYVNENAFDSDNVDVELSSGTAMFSVRSSGRNIVLSRSAFTDLLNDNNLGEYLESNYTSGNRVDLFDDLKLANDVPSLNNLIDNKFGKNFMPLIAWQNQQRIRHINQKMEDMISDENNIKPERKVIKIETNYINQDDANGFEGYEDKIYGASGLFDREVNKNNRLGIGFGLYATNTDFDSKNSRNDTIAQLYLSNKYDAENWGFLTMPFTGYSHGEYTRYDEKKHNANLNVWYAGVNNRIYAAKDFGDIKIKPVAELNVSNVYQDKIKEKNAINVKAQNSLSVEAGLGVYASKKFSFADNGNMNVEAGVMYYRELNDKAFDDLSATMSGLDGVYMIDGYDNDENHTIFSIKGEYELKNLNIYGEISHTFADNDNTIVDAGVKINF